MNELYSALRVKVVSYFLLILLFLSICLFPYFAKAEKIIKYDHHINLEIAANGINRINFGNERIKRIIGDNADYSSKIAGNGTDLFLTSKRGVGSKIEISIELSTGKICDFLIKVEDLSKPKIIKLTLEEKNYDNPERLEAALMISSMQRGIKFKYFVQNLKEDIQGVNDTNLVFKQIKSYRFGDLYGGVFEISTKKKNKAQKTYINLDKLASNFKRVIMVGSDSKYIIDNNKTKVYLVFRGSDEL